MDKVRHGVSGRDPREHASVEFGQRGVEAVVESITSGATQMLAEMS